MRPLRLQKFNLILIGIFSFLILFGGFFAIQSWFQADGKNSGTPKISQVPILEFSQSTFTNFTVFQGQEFQVNWTIAGGLGKSYHVTQIGEKTTILINFGYINKDLFYIYGPINSSQLGTYLVQLEVYNASDNTTREFTLFVKPNMDLIIPQVILIVAGSVAVAVVSTVVVERHRNRPRPKTSRDLNKQLFRVDAGSSPGLTTEDQTFISTTVIDLVVIAGVTPLESLVFKKFQDLEPEQYWKEEIFKKIPSKSSQTIPCKNIYMKINGSIRYLTCFKYPNREQVIIVISTEVLNDRFLSIFFSSLKMLAWRDPSLIDNPSEFIQELTRILCLDRSYNYKLPRTTKFARLERSRFWTSRGTPADELKPLEIDEIEEDLDGMTQDSVDAMITFFDRVEEEFETTTEKED